MSDLFSRRAFLSRSGQATAVAAGAMTSPGRAAGQAAGKKKIRLAQLGVGPEGLGRLTHTPAAPR